MPERSMPAESPLPGDEKSDIQGFITSGYGHLPEGAYLSLEFVQPAAARRWLAALTPEIATAATWPESPEGVTLKPPRALHIAFTYDGLAALGLSEAGLRSFPEEFREGMASPDRSRILGDTDASEPERWDLGGPGGPVIHALLILTAGTRADLDAWCAELRDRIAATEGGVVEHAACAQFGARPPGATEPFGFFDGIAQPKIVGIKGEGLHSGEFILGYPNEYGFYPDQPDGGGGR